MAKTKDIQRRIKSIASTKKITRAMEMVAAAKMRKAVEAALATRTYANLSWETLLRLASSGNGRATHPLLAARADIKCQAMVLITSNRGLCGGFNTAVIGEVRRVAAESGVETELILIGRKGEMLTHSFSVAAQFPKEEALIDAATVAPVARLVIESFQSGRYDRIFVAYTDFINAVRQVPRVRQLLPIVTDAADGDLGILSGEDQLGVSQAFIEEKSGRHLRTNGYGHEYMFEPSAEKVLHQVAPRLVEVQLLQAVLESTAAEHSARMAAMHQATKAASDLVSELTLFYNKARQASITAEIAEITAGVAALE